MSAVDETCIIINAKRFDETEKRPFSVDIITYNFPKIL